MVSPDERSDGTTQTSDYDAMPPSGDPTTGSPAGPVGNGTDVDAPQAAPGADDDRIVPASAAGISILRKPLVAWLVAGVLLGMLIAMAAVAIPLWRAEAQREEVRERAEVIAARVTTFEGATIDEWVAETKGLATGEYAEQLTEVFDQALRADLRENEVESVGEIQRSFVQLIEEDVAEVFVLARQTSINALRDQPVEDELRIEVTLRREDGEWLASNIVVLGPQQPTAPEAPAVPEPEGEIAPDPDAETAPADDGTADG